MLTLIEHGDVYGPEPAGMQSILLCGETIIKIGSINAVALASLDVPCAIIDASSCFVTPGFIDPHQHLIGAAGEHGFFSRMPEVPYADIVRTGITTVVGCLGTDTVTRHLTSLLAKARQLHSQGLTAYIYTGGFHVPPRTITSSVVNDLVLIPEVIGVGEVAISDVRSSQPSLAELARLVSDAYVGGMMSGKAGVTHFHVGPASGRLSLLHTLLDHHDTAADHLYPTHIGRSRELMDEAILLARRGAYVDIDTVEEDLGTWLAYYREHGGVLSRLTVSSDAHTAGGSPRKLYRQFVTAVRDHGLALGDVLPLFTCNPAGALRLAGKGRLRVGADGDILVLDQRSLELVHVFARGRQLLAYGQLGASGEEGQP
jgi:beta-aspartyl-dipeptidase (metallo-type)